MRRNYSTHSSQREGRKVLPDSSEKEEEKDLLPRGESSRILGRRDIGLLLLGR